MFEQGSFVYCLLSCSCHAWAGRSGCLDLAKGILCSSSCVILEAPRVGCLASYAMFVLGGRSRGFDLQASEAFYSCASSVALSV